jgi:YesN/AraC family two-component response regulator
LSESLKTVLIVDDEAIIRQSFVDYFEDRLWRPLQAEGGERALELMQVESPDGVVVDIRLKGMDGDDFIREAYRKKPKTAFVICTGSPEYDIPADLLKLSGVSEHIFRKPVTDMAELEKTLIRLITNIETKQD